MHSYAKISIQLKERTYDMIPRQEILVAAAVVLLLFLMIRSSLRKRSEFKFRNAVRKLELVLRPRETIKVICPQKKGRVILTSKRILFETKEGFTAVVIRNIKKVQGNNEKGNRTTVPTKMVSLTIKADQEYTIRNDCPEFEALARGLIQKTTSRKRKKETGK